MTVENEPPTVTYTVDADDCIQSVDEAWVQFATMNSKGDSLMPKNVIGKSLWSFLTDESLHVIYQRLLDIARRSQRPVEFEFRCDSPEYRRLMQMTLRPCRDGSVTFISDRKKFERIRTQTASKHELRKAKHVHRCSICNRYQLSAGTFGEIQQLAEEYLLLDMAIPAHVIWTVCPDCRNRLAAISHSNAE